ncbi:MAG: response regulator [Burkholderiales bacterium]|nr:response regulator [Anaerolineae bacterium]
MAGERILVVDDGRENREFVVEYVLQPNGYEALVAKDGREGLDMVLKHQPDLILLDLQMPRMNGIEVLQALSERNLDIPVILMTFHGSEEVAIEVYRLGVRDYVKKPYSVDEMLAAIERSLTEIRLRREKEALTERVIYANRELQQRVQELNVLYSVGKNVTALADLNQLLPNIVDAAAQVTHAEEGYLYLTEETILRCRAQKRVNKARAEAADFEAKDRIALHVAQTGQAMMLNPEQLNTSGVVSLSYTPLVFREKAIGVLGVRTVTEGGHIFTKHDSALLSALSDYAAIAIENSHNFEELQKTRERESAQIRSTFKRFVPPSVVDRVLDHPETLELGGARQEVTILFADIRGYTAWAEHAPPEQVIEVLNNYLSLAAEVVLAWQGTLDKFFGDGLMAIFNAPDQQEDHAIRAAVAALDLISVAKEMSERRGYSLSFSVGLHLGEAVVGYVGTAQAMNYTAIGDVVNLAKRIQEHAAPGQILITDTVHEQLGELATSQPLGQLKFKNRQQPATVYELQDIKND